MSHRGENMRAGLGRPPTSRFAGFLAAAAAMAVCLAGCHQRAAPPDKPVAISVPQQVSDKVQSAQTEMTAAVSMLATGYDQAVCEGEGQMARRSEGVQARAEAQLEVRRAMSEAEAQTDRRGGGPTGDDGDDGEDDGEIVIIEEPVQEPADRGDWQCFQAGDQPKCVHASASSTSQRIYRHYIDGYDLNPVTAGDVMEAFAAEITWGSERLTTAVDQGEAFSRIREDCRDGDSPLARFFSAAEDFDHRDVRSDLLRVRDDFVGGQRDVCQALPRLYASLMSDLSAEMSRRTRSGQCNAPRWDALWGD
ncbi:MAG: hypothetical protein ACOC9W_06420 [Persicimonas sp.]